MSYFPLPYRRVFLNAYAKELFLLNIVYIELVLECSAHIKQKPPGHHGIIVFTYWVHMHWSNSIAVNLWLSYFYFWREFSPIVCFFWGPSPDGPTSTHGTGCQVKQLLRIRQHWLRYIKFVFIFCDNHLSTAGNRTWDLCFTFNRLQTHAVAPMW